MVAAPGRHAQRGSAAAASIYKDARIDNGSADVVGTERRPHDLATAGVITQEQAINRTALAGATVVRLSAGGL